MLVIQSDPVEDVRGTRGITMVKSAALAFLMLSLMASPRFGFGQTTVSCMKFVISDSWTAQVFHVVDQISGWDPYLHKQYVRWAGRSLNLDDKDRQLLSEHAVLRKARGWGNGFEQAFLVDKTIEDAAALAAKDNVLTVDEAEKESQILLHFSARLSRLKESGRHETTSFRTRIITETDRIAPLIKRLCNFAEIKTLVTIPVYLVTNPEEESGGGEANGGRLVVEVQRNPDPMQFLLHESFHFLLSPHSDTIRTFAEANDLTWVTLNEGIAYALSPGVTDDLNREDTLIEQWVRANMSGRSASDSFVRIYMLAAVIRPLLRSSLENGETFSQFLPKAINKWQLAIK